MSFSTLHFPMSTLACIYRVKLDVGQKKLKKTVSVKCRVRLLFYNGNSTFSPSDFCNGRLSNVDFDLYFVDVIECFLKTLTSLSKAILFQSRRPLVLIVRPFGPLVVAWAFQGCLQDPFWLQKAGFS